MDPAELDTRLDDVLVLDVREAQEWDAGRIAQALHIPMGQLNARINEIPRDATVVCVCRSGARSGAVANALERAGWTAHNLDGGMHAWEDADLPIVDDDGDSGWVA